MYESHVGFRMCEGGRETINSEDNNFIYAKRKLSFL